ncbi:PREDICTED: uncharacterized protein LOC104803273 [Tarenaya hassleriana]|uniref:uncharacterized protein LOC104803273 n=1 Tax=Tarenaya hassleriana TaxID=28532 RepID=UPI00053C3E3F|nr:PREDICTED: uncharacterized protein LOC104803273 [Tarenaya hassleriana]
MGSTLCCLRVPDKKHGGDTAMMAATSDQKPFPATGEEFLSDASTFSVEEQARLLKAARRQERRLGHEAEQVMKWVKQESARFDQVHGLTKS